MNGVHNSMLRSIEPHNSLQSLTLLQSHGHHKLHRVSAMVVCNLNHCLKAD